MLLEQCLPTNWFSAHQACVISLLLPVRCGCGDRGSALFPSWGCCRRGSSCIPDTFGWRSCSSEERIKVLVRPSQNKPQQSSYRCLNLCTKQKTGQKREIYIATLLAGQVKVNDFTQLPETRIWASMENRRKKQMPINLQLPHKTYQSFTWCQLLA